MSVIDDAARTAKWQREQADLLRLERDSFLKAAALYDSPGAAAHAAYQRLLAECRDIAANAADDIADQCEKFAQAEREAT